MRLVAPVRGLSCICAGLIAGFGSGPSSAEVKDGAAPYVRMAQAADDAVEKQAFEAAKELGTVDAWDAFLSNYPKGFHADLARAYVKKLAADQPAAAPSAPAAKAPPPAPAATAAPMMKPSIGRIELASPFNSVASSTRAAKRPCVEGRTLASQESAEAARINFINYSPDPIEVFWIDENGAHQLYGQINKGRQATVETFVTQPWVLKYLDGTCLTIALPNPGPQIFPVGEQLERAAKPSGSSPSPASSRPPPSSKSQASSKPTASSKPAVQQKASKSSSCGSGQIRIEGKCMSKSAATGYCGPGFRVVGSKCVHQNDLQKPNKPSQAKCPKGQIWSAQEGCHYDD